MPQTDEETMAAFDEKFGKNFGWSDQDADGQIQVKSFLLTSLTNARKESYELGRADEREAITKIAKEMEQELPKMKCINAETHLFGSCFRCESIKGFNRALADLIDKLKV